MPRCVLRGGVDAEARAAVVLVVVVGARVEDAVGRKSEEGEV